MQQIYLDKTPVAPSKIICVGRNYVAHIEELGNEIPDNMVLFSKPNSAVSHQLIAQHDGEPLHYEAEICFCVKNQQLHGVGLGIDLTKRDLQSRLKGKGLPWMRSKGFDGSACFSDFISLTGIDIQSLQLNLNINGNPAQQGGYGLMIHKPDEILKEIQSFMTIRDGDIIMTGTPAGVGKIHTNDSFDGEIQSNGQTLVKHQWIAH